MKQKDKELLLKDLCARLPYGVKVQSTFYCCDGTIWKYENETLKAGLLEYKIERYKPYLFPLSSMTEEQQKEFDQLIELELKAINDEIVHTQVTTFEVDFYNKNHFDFRGLIPMGLAIDATNKNIY